MNQILQANPLGAFVGGMGAADQAAQYRNTRQLNRLLPQYGAQAMQGDQNAMQALLAAGPQGLAAVQAFQGIYGDNRGMDQRDRALGQADQQIEISRGNLEIAREQARTAAAREARVAAAEGRQAEAEAEAAALMEFAQGAAMAQSAGQLPQFLQENGETMQSVIGIDPALVTPENFGEILGTAIGGAEGIMEAFGEGEQPSIGDMTTNLPEGAYWNDPNDPSQGYTFGTAGNAPPEEPADEYQRYAAEERAAGREPLSRIDYAQAKQGNEVIYGPNGPIIERGPNAGNARLTERQSQVQLFGSQMEATGQDINDMETEYNPANFMDAASGQLGWAGNYMRDDVAQRYSAAASAWAEGALRLQTGAAATEPEIQRVVRTYFAQPGDSPETIAYKRRLRAQYLESIVASSGGTYEPGGRDLPDDPNAGRPEGAEVEGEVPDFPGMSNDDLLTADTGSMTIEQLDAWEAEMAARGY